MTTERDWSIVVTVMDQLMRPGSSVTSLPDPRVALEALTKNSFSSCAPRENYSLKIPTLPRANSARDVLPIDVLYGNYNPKSHHIEIYVNSIERHKNLYKSSFEDFVFIVRLHEFAHALVHLGLRHETRDSVLYDVNAKDSTNWRKFFSNRRKAFSKLDENCHEFIAQALTYAGIWALAESNPHRLVDVFHRIELRQQDHYKLPGRVISNIEKARWDILLDVARGDADAYRAPGFNLRTGMETLVSLTPEIEPGTGVTPTEWSIPVEEDLANSLRLALQAGDSAPSTDNTYIELLVDRFAGLKIEVFAREHPPPHFRVICGNKSANYRIIDCGQINGDLRGHYRSIKRWHTQNWEKLVDAWNRHRPSDCPVGPVRMP